MSQAFGRLTQRDIARLAGVSQTTVSLVLNNRGEAGARIAPETRDRVLQVIRETGYAADPLARRMLQQLNQIIGVFTYEPVFPSTSADFYYPFLHGIEESAEQAGCDLLLFTSAPVRDGQRRIFHENNRLRVADGCILLGRDIPAAELSRLVGEDYPFVCVGRRDDAGGQPVPYVGADYASATAQLAHRAQTLGHRRLAFVGPGTGAESARDRLEGFRRAAGADAPHLSEAAGALEVITAAGVTAVFVEYQNDAVVLAQAAAERGLDIPRDLSVVTLGDQTTPVDHPLDFSGFRIPRQEMGRQAVDLLAQQLHGEQSAAQRLLACTLNDGRTLSAPVR
ncbi:LacI family DNA-binding transcriptional regulator [Streptomyces sp. ITFR-16]|uniref:LacI family DNA-binding transcriptional regulator n=1 Tax=Streptomyces sp. ITFR-16 TaxID=3075198 RepID=UPI00288961A3|nr:LacI family DNA-binding transcriptional regulator [Streptomyces sp. ITFR-16]WNI21039.1 LacI family DNA-binding transcriptional regulator [Streptomyces sp. ITFR-16]